MVANPTVDAEGKHPRVSGEYTTIKPSYLSVAETPPRERGIPDDVSLRVVTEGNTPA